MKVLHVITGLAAGGAERSLLKVVAGMKARGVESKVVQLAAPDTLRGDFEKVGITVRNLNLRSGSDAVRVARTLRDEVNDFGAECLDCWMYYSNALSILSYAFRSHRPRIVWNIRQSFGGFRREKLPIQCSIVGNLLFSRLPDQLVYNSRVSQLEHEKLGFSAEGSQVIPNGIDLNEFQPCEALRKQIRTELTVEYGAPIVGMFARFVPRKGYDIFLKAARKIVDRVPGVRFIIAGEGTADGCKDLLREVSVASLDSKVAVLGVRRDMSALLNGCDVILLPSLFGEGMPNVVAEAMAVGKPCVVTNSGDSADLVGDLGRVIYPGDVQGAADACVELLQLCERERAAIAERCRAHIAQRYSIDKMVDGFYSAYCRQPPFRPISV